MSITDLTLKKSMPGEKPITDGTIPGLRFEPGNTKGCGKWILRFVSPTTNKRRDMGLGTYPEVGLKDARLLGMEARKLIGSGHDPISIREDVKASKKASFDALTFEAASIKVHTQKKPGWKSEKHASQWINTLQKYAFPKIGNMKVADLNFQDFATLLAPIWLDKTETASRVRQRCDTVMKWCLAHGYVTNNPVDAVDFLLPKQPGKRERVKHQPSMPWRDIPKFIQVKLRSGSNNVSRALLEFVILTAARSGEVRAATWAEIDLNANIWTLPASRTKTNLSHRVPLSSRAIEILRHQREMHPESELVFPAQRGGVLTDMVLTKFLRDHKAHSSDKDRTATAHGFRSSFRDWASENGYPRDLAERALAHIIQNQSEAAYHRTDLLEQRRGMMEARAQHVCRVEYA